MKLESTILLVCSEDRRYFGTGFVIYKDKDFSYVVTCAHVIRDIKKSSSEVFVGNQKAKIIQQGKPDEIDLAVLAVEKISAHKALRLETRVNEKTPIKVAGLCQKEKQSALVGAWVTGVLEKEQLLTSQSTQVKGWQLTFNGEDRVEPGYSGGPVIHDNKVVGIAAIQLSQDGSKAIAISIEALSYIWPDCPQELLAQSNPLNILPKKKIWSKRNNSLQSSWLVIRASTIVTLIVFICRISGLLETFELSLYDHSLRMRPPRPVDNRLTIIEATTEDLNIQRQNNEDGKGAISDQGLKEVLEILHTDDYRPSVIALDLYRDFGDSEPLQDMFEKFTQDKRVALIVVCEQSNQKNILGVSPPLGTTIPTSNVGFSNVFLDSDNVVRIHTVRSQPLPDEDCQSENSFGFLAARQYLNISRYSYKAEETFFTQENLIGSEQFPIKEIKTAGFGGYHYRDEGGGIQFLLNYRPVKESLEEIVQKPISLEQFRAGKISPEYFKDRIVLIGITGETEAADIFETPYDQTHGVVVHAHMISQLLDIAQGEHSQIWTWPLPLESLWIFVWGFCGGVSGVLISSRKHLIIVSISGSFLIYSFGIISMIFALGWIPIVPPILSFSITCLFVNFTHNRAKYLTQI